MDGYKRQIYYSKYTYKEHCQKSRSNSLDCGGNKEHDTWDMRTHGNKIKAVEKILKKKGAILQYIENYNANEVTAWLRGLQEDYIKISE